MSAEFLAVVRRGPFARPNAEEKLEYLLSRVPRREGRKDFELHALPDATRHDDEIPQIPPRGIERFRVAVLLSLRRAVRRPRL